MLEVARTVGRNMKKHILVVTKSTVPVGTAKKVRRAIQEELDKRGVEIEFDVASNPEFLKEGAAISDFMSPDRVVVGVESEACRRADDSSVPSFPLNNFRVIFYGCAICRDDQICSERHVGYPYQFYERYCQLV